MNIAPLVALYGVQVLFLKSISGSSACPPDLIVIVQRLGEKWFGLSAFLSVCPASLKLLLFTGGWIYDSFLSSL